MIYKPNRYFTFIWKISICLEIKIQQHTRHFNVSLNIIRHEQTIFSKGPLKLCVYFQPYIKFSFKKTLKFPADKGSSVIFYDETQLVSSHRVNLYVLKIVHGII